jgi:hypothetical protein
MFAVIAAIIFGLGLILDWTDADVGDAFTPGTLMMAGLFCLALHLAGVGSAVRMGSRGRSRVRR